MITGELRSRIDAIGDAIWPGGISNPLEIIEQISKAACRHGTIARLDGTMKLLAALFQPCVVFPR
jgi:hypothetical protein